MRSKEEIELYLANLIKAHEKDPDADDNFESEIEIDTLKWVLKLGEYAEHIDQSNM